MTHVVTDNCQKCKFTDCVMVCPVDCFYDVGGQLVIHPDECIDCSACVAECPVEAIYSEDEVPDSHLCAIEFNMQAACKACDSGADPIIDQQDPLPTAEDQSRQLGF